MKQFYLTFIIFTIISSSSFGQLNDNYNLTFDNQWELQHLFIDTISNINNVWQVGHPQKTIFTSAYSSPNVIVTDSINPYPTNDTSVFIITNVAIGQGFEWPHTVILSGQYYINSDTLTDYGEIEFSPDNGTTWINMLNDTVIIDTTYNLVWFWDGYEKPVLSGNSNKWKSFWVNLAELGHAYGVQDGDTVLYRFTFISDSIQTNKDGLMFDNLHFEDWVEGIEEMGFGLFKSYCYPNPAKNLLTIKFDNSLTITDIEIFDFNSKKVLNKQTSSENTVELNISELKSGIYFYKVKNIDKKIFSIGKFIKE